MKLDKMYKSKFGQRLAEEKDKVLNQDSEDLEVKPIVKVQTQEKSPIVKLETLKNEIKPAKNKSVGGLSNQQAKAVKVEQVITGDDQKEADLKPETTKDQTVEDNTTQTVNSSTSTRALKSGTYTKSKTFFLPLEFHDMFEYIKWKKKQDHSKFAIEVLDKAFTAEFGSNWRELVK